MAIFIMSMLGIGLFTNFSNTRVEYPQQCRASKLLCGEKIALSHALVSELALIDSVSLKKARSIKKFVDTHKSIAPDDLMNIKYIGPKTVEKIKQYFY
jgi:DNA uptake protein ComE-like DNA-binding protein